MIFGQVKGLTGDSRRVDIHFDTTWIDTLKGIAIIGIMFENWTNYMELASKPAWANSLGRGFASVFTFLNP
jgi:uncharacterized membrane protein